MNDLKERMMAAFVGGTAGLVFCGILVGLTYGIYFLIDLCR